MFLKGKDHRVVYVNRDDFAKDMKEQFKGNTELLKVIEKRLNKTYSKHGYISLV